MIYWSDTTFQDMVFKRLGHPYMCLIVGHKNNEKHVLNVKTVLIIL